MNVDLCRGDRFVTSVQSNILKIGSTSFEHGTAKMAEGMCCQVGEINRCAYPFNHIVECPKRDGAASIPIRFGQKEWTIFVTVKCSKEVGTLVPEISFEEFSGG